MHTCERHALHVCQGHQPTASFRASSVPAVTAYATTRLFSPTASRSAFQSVKFTALSSTGQRCDALE